MKAVVLAGGYATRLWPITKDRPKMFLPVGDRVVVDRIFDALEADDRVDEVFVSTNARFADEFEAHLAERDYEKPTLSVEDTTGESEKFGVIGALEQLVERENINDDLLVVAGDNVISFDLAGFIDFFESKGTPSLAAYDVGSRERAKSYGLVALDGETVVDFEEKPEEPSSTLVSIACYAFPAATLPKLSTYLEAGGNPDEPGWFIQWLQERGPVHAFAFDGAWFDIGTPESYLDAVGWELDGSTRIADEATVKASSLGENVHVLGDAEVVDSTLTETVVFPGATIRDADVRRSIIDEETLVEDMDLAGALVGAHTRLPSEE
ncbi:MAG: sugar phosphate nucleotidyltransferase [Halobacteriaceae archaeon]